MDEMLKDITEACARYHATPTSDPGYTAAELAKAWNVSVVVARKRVRQATEAGALVAGKRWVVDAAGRCVPYTVYRAA